MADRRKHVTAAYLAKQCGFTARWLRARAAHGDIPGAAQPAGSGGGWRFDEALFWRWWARRGENSKWLPSTAAAKHGGVASSVTVRSSDDPLKQKIDARLKEFSRAGLPR
jgi:hypothetical protein